MFRLAVFTRHCCTIRLAHSEQESDISWYGKVSDPEFLGRGDRCLQNSCVLTKLEGLKSVFVNLVDYDWFRHVADRRVEIWRRGILILCSIPFSVEFGDWNRSERHN
jgi:hypothetical protein